jgi:3-phosphoshikimate 1-carboxyvinyltransferase
MLRHFGARVDVQTRSDGSRRITVHGDAELTGRAVVVPGDPSSAAFIAAAALIVPGSDVTIANVMTNPTRTGFYTTLREMGADLTFLNERPESGDTVADIRVRTSSLRGVTVPPERGLAELKAKESDRLATTTAGLAANGIPWRVSGDDLFVDGAVKVRGGGTVETQMDHRIAMAFLVLGLATERPVTVDDASMIATSFPEFLTLMRGLGATFAEA